MTIYISLPITGQEQEAREKADLTKAMLSRAGHKVITPFEVYAGKNPVYKDHIAFDIRALLDCDASICATDGSSAKAASSKPKPRESTNCK